MDSQDVAQQVSLHIEESTPTDSDYFKISPLTSAIILSVLKKRGMSRAAMTQLTTASLT